MVKITKSNYPKFWLAFKGNVKAMPGVVFSTEDAAKANAKKGMEVREFASWEEFKNFWAGCWKDGGIKIMDGNGDIEEYGANLSPKPGKPVVESESPKLEKPPRNYPKRKR